MLYQLSYSPMRFSSPYALLNKVSECVSRMLLSMRLSNADVYPT